MAILFSLVIDSLVFEDNMVATMLWLVSLAFTLVIASLRENEIIRHNRCGIKDKILNDCNWCRCKKGSYDCDARDCRSVDMFGHFNDAIQDIDVGMEGHGVWRSTPTACEPHVHYRVGSMLCVCGEDGDWPNPVCRDTFRVLHSVEVPTDKTCTPTKLYLQGCNVCACPSTGRLDPKLCTQRECDKDDPVLQDKPIKRTDEAIDVYAECNVNGNYKLGCRTCSCLRNNRLLCGNCTKTKDKDHMYICQSVEPNQIFNVDCNLCFCDAEGRMVCSAKRCQGNVGEVDKRRLMDVDERYYELVDRPVDLHTCKVGTKYRKGCNTCVCLKDEFGVTKFACTVRRCKKNESLLRTVREDCVNGTTYELNCLRCSCVMSYDEKWQWCETESQCTNLKSQSTDLRTMHGYCEPLHSYSNDCNNCQCLSDGQTVICTDKKCSISVEIIPVLQHGYDCHKGQAYQVDCNICYCLSNGNSLCTTMKCEQ